MKKAIIITSTFLCTLLSCQTKKKERTNLLSGDQGFLYCQMEDAASEQFNKGNYNLVILREGLNDPTREREKIKEALKIANEMDELYAKWFELIETKRLKLINSNKENQIITGSRGNEKFSKINLYLLKNGSKKINFSLGSDFNGKFRKFKEKSIQMLTKSKGSKDDIATLSAKLSLEENFETIYFKKSDLLTVLTTLSALEFKITSARNIMLSSITNSVSVMNYFNYNIHEPVVTILNNPKKGGEIELEVFWAAYNDHNLIQAETEEGVSGKVKNGKTKIAVKARNENVMNLKGKATIIDQLGIKHTFPWKKTIYLN